MNAPLLHNRPLPPTESPELDAEQRALVVRVAGPKLAEEVEEYFEHGARVSPGDVVLDVGANIGAFAAACAARTGGDVTIHCYEPAPPLYAQLARAFSSHPELNRARYELHPLALTRSDLDGREIPFYYFSRFPTDSTYDIERKKLEFAAFFAKVGVDIERSLSAWGRIGRLLGRAIRALLGWLCRPENTLGVWLAWRVTGMKELRCQLASLDRIMAVRRIEQIDLLKIDVEGAELDVLEGAQAVLRRVRRVAIETDEREGRVREVMRLLSNAGLRIVSRRAPRVAAHGAAKQVLLVAERPSESSAARVRELAGPRTGTRRRQLEQTIVDGT